MAYRLLSHIHHMRLRNYNNFGPPRGRETLFYKEVVQLTPIMSMNMDTNGTFKLAFVTSYILYVTKMSASTFATCSDMVAELSF